MALTPDHKPTGREILDRYVHADDHSENGMLEVARTMEQVDKDPSDDGGDIFARAISEALGNISQKNAAHSYVIGSTGSGKSSIAYELTKSYASLPEWSPFLEVRNIETSVFDTYLCDDDHTNLVGKSRLPLYSNFVRPIANPPELPYEVRLAYVSDIDDCVRNDPTHPNCQPLKTYRRLNQPMGKNVFVSLRSQMPGLSKRVLNQCSKIVGQSGFLVGYRNGELVRAEIPGIYTDGLLSSTLFHAYASRMHGALSHVHGDFKEAVAGYLRGFELDNAMSQKNFEVSVRIACLADAQHKVGNVSGAKTGFRQALKIAEAADYAPVMARSIVSLAAIQMVEQNFKEAEKLAKRALGISEYVGHPMWIASSCLCLAKAMQEQGKRKDAKPFATRSVMLYEEIGKRPEELQDAKLTLSNCS